MSQPTSYTWNIVDDTQAPIMVMARAPDVRHVEVIFSEPVVEFEATNPVNYIITGGAGLSVLKVAKVNPQTYLLTTSKQVTGQNYTVTASNIHDLAGNLI